MMTTMRLLMVAGLASLGMCVELREMNPLVLEAEYAVRGAILDRATAIEKELALPNSTWPFTRIVRCNIGNPQALGQTPPAFARSVIAKVVAGSTVVGEDAASVRARLYMAAIGSVGAYSPSQGVGVVRDEVCEFIDKRDGNKGSRCDPEEVFLTDGASAGARHVLQLLIAGKSDSVLTPAPQYPLYSALVTVCNGTAAPYYLEEDQDWAVGLAELERAYEESVSKGSKPRALVVINPGNPTGASLPRSALEEIVRFCQRRDVILMADEVYQENVYATGPAFVSLRSVVMDLKSTVQLFSFHSVSKGITGECGLRGGYLELVNVQPEIKAQLVKLASISLCSNVLGQLAVGLMVKPPPSDSPEYAAHRADAAAKLASLEARALRVQQALNALPGVVCRPAQGAMYLFPQVTLPKKAIAHALTLKTQPDALYCMELLEATGLVVVPGSGFGQREGTWHFRTTFLPPKDQLEEVLASITTFHTNFIRRYADGGEL